MLQIISFRLTLVLLAAIAICIGGMWMWNWQRELEAREAVARSFDEYNRYVDACGNDKAGALWDLAQTARSALDRATVRRDNYSRRRATLAWLGLVLCTGLPAAFYSLRWALTGRIRPLWLLGRHRSNLSSPL